MRLTETLKQILVLTATQLKGGARRLFMARIVQALGKGGQRRAQDELHWCRDTIRKGTHELESGIECVDAFTARGRKPAEEKLPDLMHDIDAIVQSQSQNGSHVSDVASVYASECGGSAASTDRASRLH